MSDTIFGHLCWALFYSKGQGFLSDFLAAYDTSDRAPVLFSAAFPKDTLPRPALASLLKRQIRQIILDRFGKSKQQRFKGHALVKRLSKLQYLPIDIWGQLKNDYSPFNLIEALIKSGHDSDPLCAIEETTTSNTISRETGSVPDEGGLFQREKRWYVKGAQLDLYVETANQEYAELADWFLTDFLPNYGYGADKSIGMGHLRIEQDSEFASDSVLDIDKPNARLSLSLAAFPRIEQYAASYRLTTKFGRLGGNFAFSSPTGGSPLPFKKPILMYEPGAVFFTNDHLGNKPLLAGVHSDQRIRHCGIPLTLPFNISEVATHECTSA
jgi:CRISPR-associated protein Csm4